MITSVLLTIYFQRQQITTIDLEIKELEDTSKKSQPQLTNPLTNPYQNGSVEKFEEIENENEQNLVISNNANLENSINKHPQDLSQKITSKPSSSPKKNKNMHVAQKNDDEQGSSQADEDCKQSDKDQLLNSTNEKDQKNITYRVAPTPLSIFSIPHKENDAKPKSEPYKSREREELSGLFLLARNSHSSIRPSKQPKRKQSFGKVRSFKGASATKSHR